MSRKLFNFGLIIGGVFPSIFIVTAALSLLIPGCSLGGSGGPAGGCSVLDISFDGLIGFATPSFVFSFFTVPIGVFICIASAFFSDKSS